MEKTVTGHQSSCSLWSANVSHESHHTKLQPNRNLWSRMLLSVTESESAILPQSVELIAQRRSLPDFQETRV